MSNDTLLGNRTNSDSIIHDVTKGLGQIEEVNVRIMETTSGIMWQVKYKGELGVKVVIIAGEGIAKHKCLPSVLGFSKH